MRAIAPHCPVCARRGPLLLRGFSAPAHPPPHPPYRFIPSAPSWDPQTLAAPAGGAPPVTDAELARLQALSRLHLSREGGANSPYERVRRDVAAVLAAARVLRSAAADGARAAAAAAAAPAGSSPSDCSVSASVSSGSTSSSSSSSSTLAAYLDALPEEELEALAAARWARLRPDEVTEGGSAEDATRHASVSRDGYFIVPRFVDA